jgi:Tfp pilus assembly protein FimT
MNRRLFACSIALLAGFIASSRAATCVSGRYDSINYGTWVVWVNEWGSTAPCQVCANWSGNWWVSGSWSGGGIKIYAHSQAHPNIPLNSRYWVSANWDVSSPPDTGAIEYNWTFDLWTPGHADEVMVLVWVHPGAGGGWGSKIASNVWIGGVAYDVWQANPGWNVVQFIRLQETKQGSADLYGIMNWCRNNGRLTSNTFEEIAFGTEITATNGWQTFTVNNFWCGWGTW